jgi:hypothetical protein
MAFIYRIRTERYFLTYPHQQTMHIPMESKISVTFRAERISTYQIQASEINESKRRVMKTQSVNSVVIIIKRRISSLNEIRGPKRVLSSTMHALLKFSLLGQEQFRRFRFRSTNFFPRIIAERGSYLRSEWKLARSEERGDVPGWVLVVLMTTGLVTAIWTIAAPRLSTILRNSLDSMNSIR